MNESSNDHSPTHGGDAAAVAQRLGVAEPAAEFVDFSVNVNPLGPPPALSRVLSRLPGLVERYPQASADAAAAALARAHGVPPETVLVGNGSTELFSWVVQALRPSAAGWIAPAYSGYAEICRVHGVECGALQVAGPGADFSPDLGLLSPGKGTLVFLGTPNNPTGVLLERSAIRDLAQRHGTCGFVVDEAFMDFVPDAVERSLVGDGLPPNVIVVKSLTKFFAIPGLRLGMACAAPETVERIRACRVPWSVNGPAQALAPLLYDDADYARATRRAVGRLRDEFARQLEAVDGLRVFPSAANFVLVRLPSGHSASQVQAELLKKGILIRTCADFEGLDDAFCRLAVRTERENAVLTETLVAIITGRTLPRTSQTPAIMVLGTTSNAGKSVVAAGLCRHFARQGRRVAPFKAQNMALNSFVTPEGGEMGRAQVTQARAARVAPHVDMNPVLLKPTGDQGSQVVVDGHPVGNFKPREYYARKSEFRDAAHRAYDRLAGRHELIILEGAGSPAEINLRDGDFVNGDMAAHAGADMVLVADIDRGGVFATALGTVDLLPPAHRHRLKGIIINKFRGDVSLLESGIRDLERMTGIRVLGVVPYLRDLVLEEEDSQALENRSGMGECLLDMAVIRLPRISNYTDLLTFEGVSGLRVRYVESPAALGEPDLVVLPGTKNTIADTRFLFESGLAERIQALAGRIPVIGICGGYQALGERIEDPDGIEGPAAAVDGLGLLPVSTVLTARKELAQVNGVTTDACPFAAAGTTFTGYEIHMGITEPVKDPAPLELTARRGAPCRKSAGSRSEDGRVFGSYVHGLFDAPAMRRALVGWLCTRKGIDPAAIALDDADRTDAALDRLADTLAAHVDMKAMEEWIDGRR